MTWKYGEANESVGTLGATWTSGTLAIGGDALIVVTIVGNVDAIGTIAIDGSIDGEKWYQIPFRDSAGTVSTTFAVTAGLNTTEPFLVEDFNRCRVRYTRTSGGAAATMSMVAKRCRDA